MVLLLTEICYDRKMVKNCDGNGTELTLINTFFTHTHTQIYTNCY